MSVNVLDEKATTTIKQAIDSFLLSCKVEGKSYGTIECYSDKLKGFLWYANNYDFPGDITAVDLPPIVAPPIELESRAF